MNAWTVWYRSANEAERHLDVPRTKPRTRRLSFVKTRQFAGALPCHAWPRTACGSSMPGSPTSVPGDLTVAAHPNYRLSARADFNGKMRVLFITRVANLQP